MCIVGTENILLFSVPEIKQEYYHNNRYPTILCVVYIICILPIVLTSLLQLDSVNISSFFWGTAS